MLAHRMNGFHGPVFLDLQPSRWLPRGMVLVHLVVLVAVARAYPPSLPQQVLLAAIALHGLWSVVILRRVRPAKVIARLELSARHTWRVVFGDGRSVAAELQAAALVSPLMTTLSLCCVDGRRCEVLILPDQVDADAYRRLRVRVRQLVGTQT